LSGILIVEDENIEALDLKITLESAGYEVASIASRSQEAIDKSLELSPDLVLMDIILKEGSGIEAASEIKKLGIPVVYLTAHSEESTVKRALESEPYGYLLKPFDIIELQSTIDLALYQHQMEKKLRESEERFKNLYEETPLPYQSLNKDGMILEINQSWINLLGYSKEKVIGQHFCEFLAPGFDDHFKENFPKFMDPNKICSEEFKMVKEDGNIIHISYHGQIGCDSKGNFKQTHCMFHDITHQKEIENALRESEAQFRFLTHQMNDIVWTMDLSLRTTYVSPSVFKVLGYTVEERMKQEIHEQATPESLNKIQSVFVQELVLEQEGADPNRSIQLELEAYHQDGSTRWLESVVSAIRDENGALAGFHGVSRDITPRKNAEALFKESETTYRGLLDSIVEAVYVHNQEGEILDVNQGAVDMYGYTREEFLGNTPSFLGAEGKNDMDETFKTIQKAFEGEPQTFEWWGKRKNGEIFPKEVSLYNGTYFGQPIVIAIARDITQRKESENRIKDTLKEKDILIQEIHHRVKNNLQIINSLFNLQTVDIKDPETIHIFTESQNRVKSMAMIHENLYQSADLHQISFPEYVENLINNLFLTYNISQSQVKNTIQVEDVKLNIETAVPCGLIINELVSNALKYAYPTGNGKLELVLKSTSPGYLLTISDDGVGFSKDLDYKNTTTLGLQLVNNLVRQLNGKIELDTSSGTKFTINFQELKYNKRI